jgi:hypothetical protein
MWITAEMLLRKHAYSKLSTILFYFSRQSGKIKASEESNPKILEFARADLEAAEVLLKLGKAH